MNGWRKPCEHGEYHYHDASEWDIATGRLTKVTDCPGGSLVTVADLKAALTLVDAVAMTHIHCSICNADIRITQT